MKFVFKHADTGEVVAGHGFALNPVARALGLPVEAMALLAPWKAVECWAKTECLWHMDATGALLAGAPTGETA